MKGAGNLNATKQIMVKPRGKPDSTWGQAGPRPGPGAAPGLWHSITVSSEPTAAPAADELLERCFQELVRLYRHSSVGRRCLGIVHQMNTPLQVLSFQLELLEQKAREEVDLLAESPLTGADRLVTLSRYRQEKFPQMQDELEKLRHLVRSLVLQGGHEATQEKVPLDLNQVCRQELELYLAQPFFKHRVTREFHFQDGLPLLYGHYIDFSQSFRNLIDNALEAMEGRDRRHLTVVTAWRDGRLIVRLGDTGVASRPGTYSGSSNPSLPPSGPRRETGPGWDCSWCGGSWPPMGRRSGWTALPARPG